jgi:aquaglyceroporin related protein, other eukaryote
MNSIQTAPRPEWSDSANGDTIATKEHADQVEYSSTKLDSTSSSGPYPIRSALGLHEKPPVHEDHQDHIHHQLLWSRIRLTLREPFAEFCGTAIMVFFGNGSVAQVLLSAGNKAAPGANGYGAYQSISWG